MYPATYATISLELSDNTVSQYNQLVVWLKNPKSAYVFHQLKTLLIHQCRHRVWEGSGKLSFQSGILQSNSRENDHHSFVYTEKGIEEGHIIGIGLSFMFSLVLDWWGWILLFKMFNTYSWRLSNCECFSIQKLNPFLSKLILLWKGKHNFTRSIGISRAAMDNRAFERHLMYIYYIIMRSKDWCRKRFIRYNIKYTLLKYRYLVHVAVEIESKSLFRR